MNVVDSVRRGSCESAWLNRERLVSAVERENSGEKKKKKKVNLHVV